MQVDKGVNPPAQLRGEKRFQIFNEITVLLFDQRMPVSEDV